MLICRILPRRSCPRAPNSTLMQARQDGRARMMHMLVDDKADRSAFCPNRSTAAFTAATVTTSRWTSTPDPGYLFREQPLILGWDIAPAASRHPEMTHEPGRSTIQRVHTFHEPPSQRQLDDAVSTFIWMHHIRKEDNQRLR
jgi:hypothetical protein